MCLTVTTENSFVGPGVASPASSARSPPHLCAATASPCGGRCGEARAPPRRSRACPLCPLGPGPPDSRSKERPKSVRKTRAESGPGPSPLSAPNPAASRPPGPRPGPPPLPTPPPRPLVAPPGPSLRPAHLGTDRGHVQGAPGTRQRSAPGQHLRVRSEERETGTRPPSDRRARLVAHSPAARGPCCTRAPPS